MRRAWSVTPRQRVAASLFGLSIVSLALYGAGVLANRSWQFNFLPWNLFLAWLPLLMAFWLLRVLRNELWSSWLAMLVTLVWLLLLPNSFYMVSDFLHVQEAARSNLLYDVVMFTMFIGTGVLLGCCSLYMVHTELRRRVRGYGSELCVGAILLLCSFAIYLGRDLRWNSWDVLTNPAGILFDVSDHLIHPLQNGDMYTTTLSFFVLLGSFYVAGWQMARAASGQAAYIRQTR